MELGILAGVAALVLFLPGYFLLEALGLRNGRDTLERFALRVLLSVLVTSVVGLALADLGLFTFGRALLGVLLVTVAACVARAVRRGAPAETCVSGLDGLAVIGVLAAAALLFSRPHEYLFGGWDPGVYLQTGANIATTGGVNFRYPILADVDPAARELFLKVKNWPEPFSGFRLVAPAAGGLSPQFYPLYPCWVALFWKAGGLPAALGVNAFFALLAVLALYLAGRAAFDRPTALLAAALLAANVVQAWFARFSTSEILAQYFVWSGLALLALHAREDRPALGAVAGVCFSAALFAHISTLLLLAPLAAVLFWRAATARSWRDLPLWIALAAGTALAVLHNQRVAVAYINVVNYARWMLSLHQVEFAGAAVAAAAVFLAARRTRWLPRLAAHPAARGALALAIVGLAVYAFLLRPRLVMSGAEAATRQGDDLRRLLSNALSLRDMGRLFTPLGLALAVGGAAALAWRGVTRAAAPVLAVGLFAGVVVLRDKLVEPIYLFGARRFLVAVIPFFCLMVAWSLARVREWPMRGARAAALVGLGVVLLVPAYRGRETWAVSDYVGLGALTGRVAGLLQAQPGPRVVVCDDEWLAAPLHFFHGEDTLVFHGEGLRDAERLADQVRAWQGRGGAVYWLTWAEAPVALTLDFAPCGAAAFDSVRLGHSFRFFPEERVYRGAVFRLFRVTLASEAGAGRAPVAWPARVAADSCGLGAGPGLGAPRVERVLLEDFRWTDAHATFDLGELAAEAAPTAVVVRAASGRPREAGDLPVTVTLNGEPLGTVRVPPGSRFATYQLAIPAPLAAALAGRPAAVHLAGPTWRPGQDARDLGVMVERVELAGPGGARLDVGCHDGGRCTGVHAPELNTSGPALTRTVRDLADGAELVVPWVGTNRAARLRFHAGYGPPGGPGARVAVSVNGAEAGAFDVAAAVGTYELVAPAVSAGDRAVLRFGVQASSGTVVFEWTEVEPL